MDELLRKVGLYEVRDRWANRLSGGMKRRLGIAQAIVGNPKIIIVDEPTMGLENRTFNCNDSGLVCRVLGDSLRTKTEKKFQAEVRGYAMKVRSIQERQNGWNPGQRYLRMNGWN